MRFGARAPFGRIRGSAGFEWRSRWVDSVAQVAQRFAIQQRPQDGFRTVEARDQAREIVAHASADST
jgi:hypothetical protein